MKRSMVCAASRLMRRPAARTAARSHPAPGHPLLKGAPMSRPGHDYHGLARGQGAAKVTADIIGQFVIVVVKPDDMPARSHGRRSRPS